EVLPWPGANAVSRIDGGLALGSLRTQINPPGFSARPMALRQCRSAPSRPPRSAPLPGPAPVTKNVIVGDCGSCGAACCCASTPVATPSASAATTWLELRSELKGDIFNL